MHALILAAGTGHRLGPLTHERPKALVRVAGRELLHYVFDFLDSPEITRRTVVTGYGKNHIENFVSRHYPHVELIHNPFFTKGSIITLETALPALRDAFVMLNVDHIYPRRMLSLVLQHRHGIVAVCDGDRTLGDDDMKIRADDRQHLTEISKKLTHSDAGYIGMTLCDLASLDVYKQAVRETRTACGDTVAVEAVLGLLAQQGKTITLCDTSGIGWLEVDTQEDLMRAERILKDRRDFLL